eukprot:g56720.t1
MSINGQPQPVLLWDLMPESVWESPKPRTLPGLVITASRSRFCTVCLVTSFLCVLASTTNGMGFVVAIFLRPTVVYRLFSH